MRKIWRITKIGNGPGNEYPFYREAMPDVLAKTYADTNNSVEPFVALPVAEFEALIEEYMLMKAESFHHANPDQSWPLRSRILQGECPGIKIAPLVREALSKKEKPECQIP